MSRRFSLPPAGLSGRLFGPWTPPGGLIGITHHRGGLGQMPRLHWTHDRVLLELRRLDARGEHLATRRLQATGHGGLVAACYKHFGTWSAALAAAGLKAPPRRRRGVAAETLIGHIRRHARAGHDVSCSSMRALDPRLVGAVYRSPELCSWSRALELAGLPHRGRRGRWSREAILHEIRTLAGEGADLSAAAVRARRLDLVSAACRPQHFGSWREALAAAGVCPEDCLQRLPWTRRRVVETLKTLRAQGLPLSTSWLQRNGHSSLVAAARRPSMFGSWRDAVESAGIDYDQVRREARRSSRTS